MTNEYRLKVLEEARQSREDARRRFNSAEEFSEAWREAEADLNYFQGKVAFLEAS